MTAGWQPSTRHEEPHAVAVALTAQVRNQLSLHKDTAWRVEAPSHPPFEERKRQGRKHQRRDAEAARRVAPALLEP